VVLGVVDGGITKEQRKNDKRRGHGLMTPSPVLRVISPGFPTPKAKRRVWAASQKLLFYDHKLD